MYKCTQYNCENIVPNGYWLRLSEWLSDAWLLFATKNWQFFSQTNYLNRLIWKIGWIFIKEPELFFSFKNGGRVEWSCWVIRHSVGELDINPKKNYHEAGTGQKAGVQSKYRTRLQWSGINDGEQSVRPDNKYHYLPRENLHVDTNFSFPLIGPWRMISMMRRSDWFILFVFMRGAAKWLPTQSGGKCIMQMRVVRDWDISKEIHTPLAGARI